MPSYKLLMVDRKTFNFYGGLAMKRNKHIAFNGCGFLMKGVFFLLIFYGMGGGGGVVLVGFGCLSFENCMTLPS